MRLAVLADAEGQRLDAPVFRVADQLAAEALDDALETGRHLLDLLRAQILARQIDVFVQWHGMPFPCCRSSGAKPLVPFGKGREVLRKAGTRDAGPCGPAGPGAGRPFSSRPGSSGSAGYSRDFADGKLAIRQLPRLDFARCVCSSRPRMRSATLAAISAPARSWRRVSGSE